MTSGATGTSGASGRSRIPVTGEAVVLLAYAQRLLDDATPGTAGNTARLAAFVSRQAVEALVDARCAELVGVRVDGATAKSKLAILKSLDATELGPALVYAWHQLTTHCHQHAYRLSPTVGEVRATCRAVIEALPAPA